MKNVKVVVGANFGDEGKGLMTDYFCSAMSSQGNVLNVRHNGGAQAGHTVVTPDGRRHVFGHIGSGSFHPHVVTYLSKDFLLNPILFAIEIQDFKKKFRINPIVYIHPECRITIPYDMIINQIVERSRGKDRHGSCGVGINETVVRYDDTSILGYDAREILLAGQILKNPVAMVLRDIRKRYVPARLDNLGIKNLTVKERELISSNIILDNWIIQLNDMISYCKIADDTILYDYGNIVFEGAQGLLLDVDYQEFAPHLTSSKTGSHNPKQTLMNVGLEKEDIEVCYVTRSYLTRHGAGPFPTECSKSDLFDHEVTDKTNRENEFQGPLRYGHFDRDRFFFSCSSDANDTAFTFPNIKNTIAVTHLDETNDRVCFHIDTQPIESIQSAAMSFPFPVCYRTYGETRGDVYESQKK